MNKKFKLLLIALIVLLGIVVLISASTLFRHIKTDQARLPYMVGLPPDQFDNAEKTGQVVSSMAGMASDLNMVVLVQTKDMADNTYYNAGVQLSGTNLITNEMFSGYNLITSTTRVGEVVKKYYTGIPMILNSSFIENTKAEYKGEDLSKLDDNTVFESYIITTVPPSKGYKSYDLRTVESRKGSTPYDLETGDLVGEVVGVVFVQKD